MKVLFVHRSFPGQFRWLIAELVKKRFEIKFLCLEKTKWPENEINVIQVKSQGGNSIEKVGIDFADAAIKGAIQLKRTGFEPDVIVSHYGWGLWKTKSIFREAKLITYCEWMFTEKNRSHHDWGENKSSSFESEIIQDLTKDAFKTAILKSDAAICPTRWQRNTFCHDLKNLLTIVEDGFPEHLFYPKPTRSFNEEKLNIVYVSRGMEYTRGIDRLNNIIEIVNNEGLENKIVFNVLCDERRVYDDKHSWDIHFNKISQNLKSIANVNIIYQLPYNQYIDLLRKSDIHLYLSREFILSWSFIESSLLGSHILSLSNDSTIEVSHSNHINHKDAKDIASTLIKYASSESLLKEMRDNKLNWTKTTEYALYQERFSLARQVQDYINLFLT